MPLKDKEKRAEYTHKWYIKNKEKIAFDAKNRIVRNKLFLKEYKQRPDIKCMDCGEDRWQCLEFDHRDRSTKYKTVSYLVRNRSSIEKIKEEMDKCDVVCANCHRMRHNGMVWEEDSNKVV